MRKGFFETDERPGHALSTENFHEIDADVELDRKLTNRQNRLWKSDGEKTTLKRAPKSYTLGNHNAQLRRVICIMRSCPFCTSVIVAPAGTKLAQK